MVDEAPLTGDGALVTGASAGIGRASAVALARDGADVSLAARREERLTDLAATIEAEHDVRTAVVPTDVTEEAEVDRLVETTVEEFGGLDVVVNNAGLGRDEPLEEMSTEAYRQMMAVNVDGTFFTAREALPHLRESGGNLVFIGSFAGQYPRPAAPVYAATKWWTRGFALSVAGRVGDSGVGVSVVNPTEVRTEFGSEDGTPLKAEFEEGEVTEPAEVAEAVAFAARQEAPTTANEIDLYRRDKLSHF